MIWLLASQTVVNNPWEAITYLGICAMVCFVFWLILR